MGLVGKDGDMTVLLADEQHSVELLVRRGFYQEGVMAVFVPEETIPASTVFDCRKASAIFEANFLSFRAQHQDRVIPVGPAT